MDNERIGTDTTGETCRATPRIDPDARPPASIEVAVLGEPGEDSDLPPGIVWRTATDADVGQGQP